MAAACEQCGTVLRSGYVVGLPTPDDVRAYAAKLAADQRRYDLNAAALASVGRSHALREQMVRLCRGEPAGALAGIEAGKLTANVTPAQAPSAAGVGFPLARLVAGETAAIVFLEIGPDGIAVETLAGQPDELPRRAASVGMKWPDLVPDLPGDSEALRLFRLAGGIGTGWPGNPKALADVMADAARGAAATLLANVSAAVGEEAGPWGVPEASLDHVLVLRTSGWPALTAAANGAREVLAPVAEIVDLDGGALPLVVERIARGAPLRHEYALALAARGPLGRLQLDPYPLFPAGTVFQQHNWPHAQVDVRAIFPGVRRLVLPVVARTGEDQDGWKEVGRAIVDARSGARVTVRVRFDRPGAVTFRSPAPLADDPSVPHWPELRQAFPRRMPSGTATDLVVLVECGGDAAQARARLDLVDQVLGAVSHADLRVAMVGYRDHSVETSRPVTGGTLDTVRNTRAWSDRLRAWEPAKSVPGRVGDDNAAPLEDALDWVAREDVGWRPRARHLLVVIGRRPPHPPHIEDGARTLVLKCPSGIDWEMTLVKLRQDQDVECFAVVPASALRDEDADYAWRMVGAAGRMEMETTSAEQLLQALDLAPDREPQWCLAERADG
jgi:hypothetical protein